ncbi:hypothetical protein ACOVJO_06380 [Scardovia wiggsiae]|uniref:hypothetical protein n=1 Tax=Scardovia wiggsiae TaxID=230143 RepID=UPI003BAADAE4
MSDSNLGFSRIDVFVTHVFSRRIVGWAIFHNENYTVTVEGVGTKYPRGAASRGYARADSS